MSVNTVTGRVLRAAAVALLGAAVAGAPALTYAQPGFGGGGHGGGGHYAGGAHFGGAPHFGGAAHFAAPHYSAHFSGYGAHGYTAASHFAGGAHFAPAAHYGGWTGRYGAGWYGGHYWAGARFWGGGYWNGVFWPHIGFYPGWAWFLPVLPLGYATFWWGGVPYYYYNSLYYTWNPGYNGYVVTDPPPAAGDNAAADTSSDYSGDNSAGQYAPPAANQPVSPGGAGAGDVFLYPRNGQSETQTQNDRYECHSWAVNQTGFDPTRSSQQGSGTAADYRRAMIACLDARGYSAR